LGASNTVNDSGPLVSVIIPAYNAGEYLIEAVESILCQTYPNVEIVLVDDGSTDGSVDALKKSVELDRLRIIRQENAGKPAALNRALDEIRGSYYALQDADDASAPERIATQVRYLESHPEVAGVFCGYAFVIDGTWCAPTRRGKTPAASALDIASATMPGHDPTAMYRISMVGDMRYSEDLPIVEGYDYVLRVGERYPMAVVDGCLYRYRIHWASVTRANPGKRDTLLREAVARMAQRRDARPPEDPEPEAAHRKIDSDNYIYSHFLDSVAESVSAGKRAEAFRTAWTCFRLRPTDKNYAKGLIFACIPADLVRKYRERSAERRRRVRSLRYGLTQED